MRRLLLAAVALGGLAAFTGFGAQAAPSAGLAGIHAALPSRAVTQANWYWNHRYWHHRHWHHDHWRFWD